MAYANLAPAGAHNPPLIGAGIDDAGLLAGAHVSHMLEAWRYFGAAVNALLVNSPHNAIHFAYYAQLRSAMSIFSGEGVYVQQDSYFYLDSHGRKQAFMAGGTHSFVWKFWKEWIKSQSAEDLIGRNIKLMPLVTLSDIALSPRPGGVLERWGFDLSVGATDRNARNAASYDSKAPYPIPVLTDEHIAIVRSIWRLLLSDDSAVAFDAAFVRYLVDLAVSDADAAGRADGNPITKEEQLEQIATQVASATGEDSAALLRRLSDPTGDYLLFQAASEPSQEVVNVLARALFLVRIATLSVAKVLAADQVATTNCRNWIKCWMSAIGVMPEGDFEISDLVADFEVALQELSDSAVEQLPRSLWTNGLAEYTARLSRVESACAWGLAL
ncbi:hypothetical protein [Stenotrophomonas muris]|uniref:hypothetical protein n=1 Tax=Stenotrophomonas muris TaxID=2963283 RepID=UPI002E75FB13|nr:hypothetical protein [Stenotrophomonas muris]